MQIEVRLGAFLILALALADAVLHSGNHILGISLLQSDCRFHRMHCKWKLCQAPCFTVEQSMHCKQKLCQGLCFTV